MRTILILEIEHRKPIPALANMVAGRAYTIDGVTNAQPFRSPAANDVNLEPAGFTLSELSLGSQDVHRS